MNKKEIQEKLNNLPEPEYLYQRHNGYINKFVVTDDYILDISSGMNVKENLLLGKIDKNIIELLEIGDIVEVLDEFDNRSKFVICDYSILFILNQKFIAKKFKLLSVMTKEQFEKDKFEV